MTEITNCPDCNERILASAKFCQHCGCHIVFDQPPEKHTEADSYAPPKVAACQSCNVALISTQKDKSFSFGGFVGAITVVIGLFALLFNVIVGAVLIILGIVVGSVGNKKTVMVCPSCGEEGARIA